MTTVSTFTKKTKSIHQNDGGPLKGISPLAGNPVKPPLYALRMTRTKYPDRDIQVADPRATRAMIALMDMQAQLAGAASHWGGPSAFAELMSALHALMFDEAQLAQKPWHELFNFVNDAGHCENGLYALKANYGWAGLNLDSLKKFRSIHSFLTGHGEAHLFRQGVWISNGPLGSGIGQAQGLALADHLSGQKERVTVCAISDGGCMEGEARESLAALPGFAARGLLAPFVLVISDNNTKLTGRIDQDSYSMEPTFQSLVHLGWEVLELPNGHDLRQVLEVVDQAFQLAQTHPLKPVAIWAKTVKGFGVKSTENSASGGHGFPLKSGQELKAFLQEIYGEASLPAEFIKWSEELSRQTAVAAPVWTLTEQGPLSKISQGSTMKVQAGVAQALLSAREKGLPVVSVSADLQGSTGVADFHKKFPQFSFDVGVAEANMISVGIGLSKAGFIPVVDTFSQFGVTKGNLPLLMAGLSEGPVIGIFSHVGFQDAADGASHQALSYLAATCSLPHTDVYALTSCGEAEILVAQALEQFAHERLQGKVPRSQIFFLGRENFPRFFVTPQAILDQGQQVGDFYKLGKAQVLWDGWIERPQHQGLALTIVASGALVGEALLAAQHLEKLGVLSVVMNPSVINRPDVPTLAQAVQKTHGNLLTVEDHQLTGGMGSMVVHALARNGTNIAHYQGLGVCDQFGQSAYQAHDLYRKHGLDAEGIVEAVKKRWKSFLT